MKREIKFRVWCKQQEEMNIVEKMHFFDDGSFWCAEDKDKDLQPPYFYDDDDFELMQFTGLHDKNGVPIYEGDIIADNRNEKYEVVFDDINLCYSGKFLKTLELFQLNKNNVLTVLGNKYSNTELLKKDGN